MTRWLDEEAEEVYLLGNAKPGICECCGREVEHIFATPSQTMYEDDERNKDQMLCLDCSIWYTEEIEERWREYWGSRL
jgi:hypothetical protein